MQPREPEKPVFGGRALRHGVLMVGPTAVAVAVRRPDGSIGVEVEPFKMPWAWARPIPMLRGMVAMAGTLRLALRSVQMERRLVAADGSPWRRRAASAAPVAGMAVAEQALRLLVRRGAAGARVVPLEALSGLAMPFVAFAIVGRLPNMGETLQYHGAEHMAVNTAEAGLPLTAEHASGMSRIHPRCGTGFAFWTLLIGAIARSRFGRLSPVRRNLFGLLSGPVIMGLAYEIVRLGARHKDHPVARVAFGPAWQAQRLTTAAPTDDQLEVACAALNAVMNFSPAQG
jgi:uncharacterized protein YqhQ